MINLRNFTDFEFVFWGKKGGSIDFTPSRIGRGRTGAHLSSFAKVWAFAVDDVVPSSSVLGGINVGEVNELKVFVHCK